MSARPPCVSRIQYIPARHTSALADPLDVATRGVTGQIALCHAAPGHVQRLKPADRNAAG